MRLAFVFLALFLSSIALAGIANATQCSSIFDCGYRQTCQAGTCVYDGLACKYDYECAPFQYCNTGVYECALQEGRCNTASDCTGGDICDADNYCQASGSSQNDNSTLADSNMSNPVSILDINKTSVNETMNRTVGQLTSPQFKGTFMDFWNWAVAMVQQMTSQILGSYFPKK